LLAFFLFVDFVCLLFLHGIVKKNMFSF